MLGMTTFHKITGLLGHLEFWVCAVLLACGSAYTLGCVEAAVGLSTACVILYVSRSNRVILFLGTISYSLYLIHLPTGVKVVDLGIRWAKGWASQLVLLVVGLGVSIGAAYLLYRFVEKPAQRWSSGIRYKRK